MADELCRPHIKELTQDSQSGSLSKLAIEFSKMTFEEVKATGQAMEKCSQEMRKDDPNLPALRVNVDENQRKVALEAGKDFVQSFRAGDYAEAAQSYKTALFHGDWQVVSSYDQDYNAPPKDTVYRDFSKGFIPTFVHIPKPSL